MIYTAAFESVVKYLRTGMTGDEIYDKVAGPGSLTGKLHDFLEENNWYHLIEECVRRTVTECKK